MATLGHKLALAMTLMTVITSNQFARGAAAAQTSESLSLVTNIAATVAEVTNTVHVQAVDVNGNLQTTGGDTFKLIVEEQCSWVGQGQSCTPDPFAVVIPELPIEVIMTDNGDGTYEADYMVTGVAGLVSVSVDLVMKNSLYVEYYNYSDRTAVRATRPSERTADYGLYEQSNLDY